MWGATEDAGFALRHIVVSIHAPRVGCDITYITMAYEMDRFNSRTPCGVRLWIVAPLADTLGFQFTHPVWGATTAHTLKELFLEFQFTHPVWGATQESLTSFVFTNVSIHAPRVGCDLKVTNERQR